MTLRFEDARPSTKSRALVSLYTGAGGMDYGFEAAGFRTAIALELDRDCCATLRANRPWPVIERPIEAVPSVEILETAGLRPGEVDLLIGGPPCQPFSKSAYWTNGDTRRLSDPRARTLYEYMRCVGDLRPEVFVLENVHGISYSGKEEGFRLLWRLTTEINVKCGTDYALSWRVINAAEYGVPQIRERFFLVGHRGGRQFEFPRVTHMMPGATIRQAALFGETMPACPTAWDAIGRLKRPRDEDLRMKGQWAELLPSIPEGENYLWHTKRKGGLPLFGWRTRYWSFLLKLAKDRPSWTIQAQPGPAIGPFHWENRLLSVDEMAALQTFPPGLKFCGGRVSIQRQLGNAVPSLLTEVLGRAIGEQYFRRRCSEAPRLAVHPQRPIPPPAPPAPVPAKFLHMMGDHPSHDELKREGQARLDTELAAVAE